LVFAIAGICLNQRLINIECFRSNARYKMENDYAPGIFRMRIR
jgi:hypothetical protein